MIYILPTDNNNRVKDVSGTSQAIGHRIIRLVKVTSTNEVAQRRTKSIQDEGTVYVAKMQTGGRGRMGRRWFSPEGGLWFSIVVFPNIPPSQGIIFTFLSSLAVCKAIKELYSLKSTSIKWPNDVMVAGRKISGILIESEPYNDNHLQVVLGIGINVNILEEAFPEDIRESATSLQRELGKKVSVENLLNKVLQNLDTLYNVFNRQGTQLILEEWKKYTSTLGKWCRVVGSDYILEGIASSIESDGSLTLLKSDGQHSRVYVGDITLRESEKT